MTTREDAVEQPYRCPKCDGDLTVVGQSWCCVECGYVPNHAAD